MEIIIERFEMARVCKALRKKEWQLTGGYGNDTIVKLKFTKIKEINLSTPTNIVDVLEHIDGH